MNAKVESSEFRLDPLKWLLVIVLVVGGAVANSYFSSEIGLLYRVLAMVAVGAFSIFVVVNTEKGSSFWGLLKSAQVEFKKIIWPTSAETIQTTMIVVAVVIVTAAFLSFLDAGLNFLVSQVIG
ncbi:MAG: preprotein translocase subunit SecE [Alteromonadaceae bacterium]|nr:MAG: preprotein translocase subunit SecE [Alteromonadaceae bacterium]